MKLFLCIHFLLVFKKYFNIYFVARVGNKKKLNEIKKVSRVFKKKKCRSLY